MSSQYNFHQVRGHTVPANVIYAGNNSSIELDHDNGSVVINGDLKSNTLDRIVTALKLLLIDKGIIQNEAEWDDYLKAIELADKLTEAK